MSKAHYRAAADCQLTPKQSRWRWRIWNFDFGLKLLFAAMPMPWQIFRKNVLPTAVSSLSLLISPLFPVSPSFTPHHHHHLRGSSYLRPLCPPHLSPAFDSSASRGRKNTRNSWGGSVKSHNKPSSLLSPTFLPAFVQRLRERWMQPVELIAPRYWTSASLHCWHADLPYGCPLGEHFD